MKNYFDKLQSKINKYKNTYSDRPNKAALKLCLWNLKCVFAKHIIDKQSPTFDLSDNVDLYALSAKNKLPVGSWFRIEDKKGKDVTEKCKIKHPFMIPEIPTHGHIYFDIDKALELNPDIKRIGLVFFMGIGDYFYATNFIEMLHKKYGNLEIDAYVSQNFDRNNSPLVGKCLEKNPNIKKIFYYNGKTSDSYWENYDYSQCYTLKSDDTLLVPVVYKHGENVDSRTTVLCETFNLPAPSINPSPIIYDYEPTTEVKDTFVKYKDRMKKVVFIQMTSRSTYFSYPHIDNLIKELIKEGYFVISFDKTDMTDDDLLVIDIKKFTINDSISLIRMVKENDIDVYFLTVASCFSSISSALGIPHLCIQQFYDICISSVYYSNIYLITGKYYKRIAADRQYIVPEKYQRETAADVTVYSPEYIMKCFEDFALRVSI